MAEVGRLGNSRITPSPTLRELAALLFRQSRYAVLSFAVVFLASLLYALLAPNYEAHFKVMLRRGRSDPVVSAQPAAPDFTRPTISEEELNSEVELLRDEGLLKQVVVQSGLVAPRDIVAGRSEQVERAARKLARSLTVEPLKKSNLIQVRYTAGGPQEAANVLSTLSAFYLRKHMELQRPSGEVQFFEKQTAEYESRLNQSEAELVRFTRDRGVAEPALERDIALQKLGEAEAAYRQVDQDQVENQRRATSLNTQLKAFPARSVTLKRWADNPQLLEKLKTHLLELQLKRSDLLIRYEPSYRLVQEVDREIAETNQSIAGESLTPVRDETTDKDPNYEWARMELEKTQVQHESLRERQAKASKQIAALREESEQLQADAVAQQQLVRAVKADEENFLLDQRKLEEARIGDALDDRRILNVALVGPPVAPALPVHSMLFWFALSLGLAVPAGIGAGFAAEYFDPTIRTPHEADQLLEAPVLAWLPEARQTIAGSVVLRFSRPKDVLP
ncbi:MAG TPA: hypothetical protein VNW47_10560 [Terriglobales bacterium]|nr:hypothetical protein [Terriglobales bacterium]